MVRSAVASALCTLPPVVNRFARERIQSYYFVSENETDREGGYNELVEHCYDVLSHGDSIILFLPPSKEDNESKDVAIGGISEALHKLEGGSTEQQLKTIVRNVTEAARQLYN
ncbi:hypothetical protein AGDE_14057 [Angomonas deanei]|uniref:Uncharacterized protein n=1 Tax=Angomonas deanei TaxID=59799 RepID=A0A7G2CMJ9_9TRYP|nr:hypothetical protein AGDE_14057 [Angomonas deanei]CAD2219773.1 hypothetical protein, conserved [Angomonas deanei]|eukprot:EPY21477.1 hypothetical protein AGDE_14057 [Angomonas deanei]